MPKKNTPSMPLDEMRAKVLERVGEMWDMHQNGQDAIEGHPRVEGFLKILEEAEVKKVNLNFTITLDLPESAPTSRVRMRFSQVTTDERTDTYEDPNQGELPVILNGADEQTKKRRQKAPKEEQEKAIDV